MRHYSFKALSFGHKVVNLYEASASNGPFRCDIRQGHETRKCLIVGVVHQSRNKILKSCSYATEQSKKVYVYIDGMCCCDAATSS